MIVAQTETPSAEAGQPGVTYLTEPQPGATATMPAGMQLAPQVQYVQALFRGGSRRRRRHFALTFENIFRGAS